MAENNSKKPMALLLLVVVGVLVVLWFANNGDSNCNTAAACSDVTATTKEACDAIEGAKWSESEALEAEDAAACADKGGVWTEPATEEEAGEEEAPAGEEEAPAAG